MDKSRRRQLIIIGSGPAAYTAAIYAARANLQPLVFEGSLVGGGAGGQLMTTTEVENFPGFPDGILGPELVALFRKQAARFGSELVSEDVLSLKLDRHPFEVKLSLGVFEAEAVIIATGAYAKRLDVPGTRDGEFWQKGVTACATCDGAAPLFRNKPLFVIGGGDTAIEEALFLTRFGSKIFIVHRRSELRASKIMAKRILDHPKVEVIWNHTLERVEGDKVVNRVLLKEVRTGKETSYEAGGVFFAIGHQPLTAFLEGQVEMNPHGYIQVIPGTTKTNIGGIFAAGDVQDPVYRQAVTAAGSGCMAALDAERWLLTQNPNRYS